MESSNHSYKNPPVLQESQKYEDWKIEIGFWQKVTDLDKKAGFCSCLLLQVNSEMWGEVSRLKNWTVTMGRKTSWRN